MCLRLSVPWQWHNSKGRGISAPASSLECNGNVCNGHIMLGEGNDPIHLATDDNLDCCPASGHQMPKWKREYHYWMIWLGCLCGSCDLFAGLCCPCYRMLQNGPFDYWILALFCLLFFSDDRIRQPQLLNFDFFLHFCFRCHCRLSAIHIQEFGIFFQNLISGSCFLFQKKEETMRANNFDAVPNGTRQKIDVCMNN